VQLLGNRYWSEFLSETAGQRVVARFDPQDLHAGLHIYTGDGRYLGFAECVELVGFDDTEKARERARNVKLLNRGVRMQAEAEVRLSASDVAAALPSPETPVPATPAVTRIAFDRNAAPAVSRDMEREEDTDMLRRVAANVTVLADIKRREDL
jgi:hypothetical protein